jgi:hypothetical protein
LISISVGIFSLPRGPSSSSEPLLHLCSPILPPAQSFSPGRRSAIVAAVHLLLPSSPRVTLTLPAAVAPPRYPAPRVPRFPRTPVGRHLTAAVESPQAKPRTSISRVHEHRMSPYISFLRFLCQFSSARPKPHSRPSPSTPAALGIAVGSRHQAPLAPIDPRASFPVPYWCSPTPWCSPISVGALLPTKRRRRLRPRHGISLSGLPQLQLTPHRASSHRQDAFRPLLRHPRAPEYSSRHFFPTAGHRSLLHCHNRPPSSDPVQLNAYEHPVVPLPPLRPHRRRPSSPEMAAQPLPPFTSGQGRRVRRSKSPGGCLQTIGLRETVLLGTPV